MIRLTFALLAASLLSGCMVKRTVKDSSGQVIYSEPEVHSPFEKDAKKRQEVQEKEWELGGMNSI